MDLSTLIEKWDSLLFYTFNKVSDLLFVFKYPKLKHLLLKNKDIKNLYKGKRCFIVLNGPSINSHDLRALKDEYVFATNYFFKSPLCSIVAPNFYCWLDAKAFFEEGWETLLRELKEACPNAKFLFNAKSAKIIESDANTYFVYAKHISNYYGSSNNLERVSTNYYTVAFFAMASAIYMGFSEIYVLGLDFEPGGFKHFTNLGEGTECVRPDEKTLKKDVCGLHWGYVKAQYESYYIADFAKKNNCRIINLNPNSCIRAFEFGDYKDIVI